MDEAPGSPSRGGWGPTALMNVKEGEVDYRRVKTRSGL
jgi:hypothetical protein